MFVSCCGRHYREKGEESTVGRVDIRPPRVVFVGMISHLYLENKMRIQIYQSYFRGLGSFAVIYHILVSRSGSQHLGCFLIFCSHSQ